MGAGCEHRLVNGANCDVAASRRCDKCEAALCDQHRQEYRPRGEFDRIYERLSLCATCVDNERSVDQQKNLERERDRWERYRQLVENCAAPLMRPEPCEFVVGGAVPIYPSEIEYETWPYKFRNDHVWEFGEHQMEPITPPVDWCVLVDRISDGSSSPDIEVLMRRDCSAIAETTGLYLQTVKFAPLEHEFQDGLVAPLRRNRLTRAKKRVRGRNAWGRPGTTYPGKTFGIRDVEGLTWFSLADMERGIRARSGI